jgi:hypothetical protein
MKQACEDCLPDGRTIPRVLVIDLITPLIKHPMERGDMLRRLASTCFPPSLSPQWAGNPKALRQFIDTLPHKVERIIELTQNPLKMVRDIDVQIPEAKLSEAKLSEAKLSEAKLSEAKLSEAKLSEAKLPELETTTPEKRGYSVEYVTPDPAPAQPQASKRLPKRRKPAA